MIGFRRVTPLLLVWCTAMVAGPDLAGLFTDGAKALASGNLTQAEQNFRRVLESQPNHIGALGNLGVVYLRGERLADAAAICDRALKLAPQDPGLHLNRGLAALRQEDYRTAALHFTAVLRVKPEHRQAQELLATTGLFTGDVDAAIAKLEALRAPGNQGVLYFLAVGYLRSGRRDQARKTMDELFASLPPGQAHFLSGRAMYEAALFAEALAELDKAAEVDSTIPGLQRERGKILVSLRRSDEARQALEAALKSNASDTEAEYFWGALLLREYRERDAEMGMDLLEKARAARPDFWGPQYYLGKAKLETGDSGAAIELLEKAARLNPAEPAIFYNLARALRKAGKEKEAAAAMARFKSLQRSANPNNTSVQEEAIIEE